MSLLTIPTDILRLIPVIIDGIVTIIKGRKHAEEIGKADSIDENSSVEDINKILDVFSDYKKQISEKTSKLEEIFMEEVEAYIGELKDILEGKQEVIKRYGLRPERLERRLNRLSKGIQGCIGKEVSKKISLDNYECSQIMKMIPGAKKEEALTKFFKDTVKLALDKCCDELQAMLEEFFEETEEELVEVINTVQKDNERNAADLASVDKDNYVEKTLEIQGKSYYILSVCDMADSIMGVD